MAISKLPGAPEFPTEGIIKRATDGTVQWTSGPDVLGSISPSGTPSGTIGTMNLTRVAGVQKIVLSPNAGTAGIAAKTERGSTITTTSTTAGGTTTATPSFVGSDPNRNEQTQLISNIIVSTTANTGAATINVTAQNQPSLL